jgi:ABC-2 type transport system ATP-binding protein/lipopolysaccharide transport system ATP-binding protein
MALIRLDNVDVDFAVYGARGRSFRHMLTARNVGGHLNTSKHDLVVIEALRNVTLTFSDGDRVALIGHNGAGKSTLLKVLSGIYEPVRGEIEIRGSVSCLTDIGMGFDFETTGYDNIIMRGVLLGLSLREAKAMIPGVAEFSGLADYLALPLRTYSTGMMVRLGLAVCTSFDPEILIMDEMIGASDEYFIKKAKARTKQFIEKASIMVLASHSEEIVTEFCNKAIALQGGRVVAAGSPDEVLEAYRELNAKEKA